MLIELSEDEEGVIMGALHCLFRGGGHQPLILGGLSRHQAMFASALLDTLEERAAERLAKKGVDNGPSRGE